MLDWIRNVDAGWLWMAAGLLLCTLELAAPGVYLLWIGVAALVTAVVVIATGIGLVPQLGLFALLAVVSVYIGKRLVSDRGIASDDPLLNDRLSRLVGETVVVDQAIAGGRGRVRVADGVWPASGPDLPVGTMARVVAARSDALVVEAL